MIHGIKSFSLPVLLSLAGIGLLIPSLSFGCIRPVQARGQQNQSSPVDKVAGGADCNWNTGACTMLHAYLAKGGTDPRCVAGLQQVVQVERLEQALLNASQQSPELIKKARELQRLRDRLLDRVPADCFRGI